MMVREHTWFDFSSLKFVQFCLMTQVGSTLVTVTWALEKYVCSVLLGECPVNVD